MPPPGPLALLSILLLAYVAGATPFGFLVAKWKGIDIREHGSGNIGATNVIRVLGKKIGIPVFAMDMLKGLLPVVAARLWCIQTGHEPTWPMLLAGWFVLGIAYSMSVTPSGRLLRRSANAEDRPAVFAAQFALSHGCWLICYPLAGQIGAGVGQVAAFAVLATVAGIGTFASLWLWPSHDPALVAHSHDDLPPDHAHMREDHDHGKTKSHAFVIDDIHPDWPRVA